MKKGLLVATILVLACGAMCQVRTPRSITASSQQAAAKQQMYVGNISPESTTACKYTFTSGNGIRYLKYCVTNNGNITQFESPKGVEYIQTGTIGEGYAFCDFDSSTAYFDYAGYGDSGNWQPTKQTAKTATGVKFSRATNDGIYTLTQSIDQDAGNVLADVTMGIKNNSGSSHHIGLLRYADVDANSSMLNDFDYTFHTALGYNSGVNGLQERYVSGAALNGAFTQDISGGPDACQPFEHVLAPLAGVDGSIFIQYDITLAPGATSTVKVNYKAF